MSSPIPSPFECPTCKVSFASKYSLERHCGRKHKINKGATDSNQGATDSNHGATTGSNSCGSTITNSENSRNTCPMCCNDFLRKRYLIKHIENCKGKKNKLQCEYCEKEFTHEKSRFHHYKICATKKEMAVIEAKKTLHDNSGQMNNQLINGIQNNTQNNNFIIVYNPTGNTPFSTDHLKAEDFKKILKLAADRLDNRIISEYSKQLFQNEENRCIKKTNINANHSQIHRGDNKWEAELDKNIYPHLANGLANKMSEYVDQQRESFKKDMYIRLRDFVDSMCDAGYINPEPTIREKEIQKEYKMFIDGLKLIVYGNTKI